ncbi:MAG TPA: hypothetical protein DCE56_26060, partial [Cyanobacteria bacterium UBA8553]|nr:hypothetical protein [Cyanobacteria bacterium UBA8553]
MPTILQLRSVTGAKEIKFLFGKMPSINTIELTPVAWSRKRMSTFPSALKSPVPTMLMLDGRAGKMYVLTMSMVPFINHRALSPM